jgi:hypothetical protein
MTMSRFRKMTDYWLRYPPPHLSLSGIVGALGGKSSSEKTSSHRQATEEEYVPPEIDSTNDVTGLLAGPVFSGSFTVKKPHAIFIDNRNRKN